MSYPHLNLSGSFDDQRVETPEALLAQVMPAIVNSLPGVVAARVYRALPTGLIVWAATQEDLEQGQTVPYDAVPLGEQAMATRTIMTTNAEPYRMLVPMHRINVIALLDLSLSAVPDEMMHSLVDMLGQQVGLLLENYHLQNLLSRQIATTSALSQAESLSEVLRVLAEYMVATNQFVALCRFQKEDDVVSDVEILASANQAASYTEVEMLTSQQDLVRSIYQRLKADGEYLIEDVTTLTASNAESIDWFAKWQVHSAYLLPLERDADPEVFIAIIDTEARLSLSDTEKLLYQNLVQQAAVTIDKQNLLQSAEDERAAAQQLYQLTSDLLAAENILDLLRVLQRYVKPTPAILMLSEMQYDEKGRLQSYVARHRLSANGEVRSDIQAHELLSEAERARLVDYWRQEGDQLDLRPDVANLQRPLPDSDKLIAQGVRAYITIPFVENGFLTYSINLVWPDPQEFSDKLVRLLKTAQRQIKLVLGNRLALAQTQAVAQQAGQELRVLRLLNDVIGDSSEQDEGPFLQRATEVLLEATEVDHVRVALVDERGGMITTVAETPDNETVGQQFAATADDSIVQTLQAQEAPIIIHDLTSATDLNQSERQDLLESGYQAVVFLPLLDSRQTLLGTVSLELRESISDFSDEILGLAQTIVTQVAVNLQRSRLLKRSRRQARQLRQITEFGQFVQTTLELREILDISLRFSQTIMPSDYFSIMTYDRQGAALRLVASYRDGESEVMLLGDKVTSESNTVAQTAWDEQTLVHVANLRADWEWKHPIDNVLRTIIACPLMVRGQLLGVAEVGNYQANAYDDLDLTALRQMVNQIAVTLSNAETYVQTQQQARNKAMANEIIAKLQQQSSVEEIIAVTAQELGQALGAKKARIRLSATPPDNQGDAGE